MENNFNDYIVYNTQGIVKTIPSITVYRNGHIRFNRASVELLGLDNGSCVSFYQQKRDTTIWGVEKTQTGIIVRDHKRGMKTRCTSFAIAFMDSLGVLDRCGKFRIDTDLNKDGINEIIKKNLMEQNHK